MRLSDLCVGDTFRVVKVHGGDAVAKRLVDMGLTQGVEGELVRCAMLGDPVQIRILGYNLSLRRSEAADVEIELLKREHGRRHRHGRGAGVRPFGHGPGPGRGFGRGRGTGFGFRRW